MMVMVEVVVLLDAVATNPKTAGATPTSPRAMELPVDAVPALMLLLLDAAVVLVVMVDAAATRHALMMAMVVVMVVAWSRQVSLWPLVGRPAGTRMPLQFVGLIPTGNRLASVDAVVAVVGLLAGVDAPLLVAPRQ